MKHFVIVLLMLCTLQSFAGVPASYGKRLNALTDMPLIGCSNFSGAGVVDESAKLQALYNKFNNVDAASLRDSGFTILWPEGLSWTMVNSQVFGEGYVKIEGAHFFYNDFSTMGENTPMILFIGKSKVWMKNVTITGSHTKLVGALVQLNSNPNHCDSATFDHCYFGDAAVQNALNFGYAGSDNDWDYWIDHVTISYSSFKHIWTQGYRVNPADLDLGTPLFKYNNRGINFQQTTLRAKVIYCEGDDISSDWLFGAGSTRAMKQHRKAGKYYANWEIAFNNVTKCGMMVETNGNTRGSGMWIHDNSFLYSTRNGGYLISANISNQLRIQNNYLLNDDRGLIEFAGNECIVSHNTGRIEPYRDTTQGYPPTYLGVGVDRIRFIEGYGSSNIIDGNNFSCDRTDPYIFSPAEYNGIAIIGMTTSPEYGDTVYNGSNRATGWLIANNIITGCTHRVMDITNRAVDQITFTNNFVTCTTMLESPIQIWGDKWVIVLNQFHLEKCYPTSGNAVIKLNAAQVTNPNAVVANNITWNPAWKTKYWWTGASATNIFK